jgi:hypothetical protein
VLGTHIYDHTIGQIYEKKTTHSEGQHKFPIIINFYCYKNHNFECHSCKTGKHLPHIKIGAQIFKIKKVFTKRTSFGEKEEEQAHSSAQDLHKVQERGNF